MKIYPYPLFINLTQHCNYSCSYCYTDSSPQSEKESFVTKNWKGILDEILTLKIPEVRLAGGEPFLYKNIEGICRDLFDNNILFSITTNGKLIQKNIQWLKKTPAKTIWISFHNEFTTSINYFKYIQQAKLGSEAVGLNVFLEDLTNSDFLGELTLQEYDRLKVLYKTPIGRQILKKEQLVSENLLEALHNLKEKNIEVRIESPLLVSSEKGIKSCPLKERPLITINFDGTVNECCAMSNNVSRPFGDLKNEKLSMIISKYNKSQTDTIPCYKLFPEVHSGGQSCPLHLTKLV